MEAIAIRTGDHPKLEALLAQRIYEYNATATGHHDAQSFIATHPGESDHMDAGISGYTWGGCCYVAYLWVAEPLRGKGIGSELLKAAERHALAKGCRVVFLASHSFQAPEFYTRRGYTEMFRVTDHPVGHENIHFVKRLYTRP